jgi:hypothetical protein
MSQAIFGHVDYSSIGHEAVLNNSAGAEGQTPSGVLPLQQKHSR